MQPLASLDNLPPLLRKLFDIEDIKAFRKAVLRELLPQWKALHSAKTRQQPGPQPLTALEVWKAAAEVLDQLEWYDKWGGLHRNDEWHSLTWKEFIARIQPKVKPHQTGSKQRGCLYSEATIRRHAWDYICCILYFDEIPPRLLDRRRPLLRGAKTHTELLEIFYKHKASLPWPAGFEDFMK
jgi:hypothetical protein